MKTSLHVDVGEGRTHLIFVKSDDNSLYLYHNLARYKEFKEFQKRILVATNLFERGIDIERVNIVFNYDMPEDTDTYLHRVVRAGRFGTKGLAITYVVNESDLAILNAIQNRFEVQITEMPNEIDTDTYVENR
ncbi:unnamed protein product [Rotaria sp. Silwood2]|nr:unnamed protein product [Rotaria sp. Silwood2]